MPVDISALKNYHLEALRVQLCNYLVWIDEANGVFFLASRHKSRRDWTLADIILEKGYHELKTGIRVTEEYDPIWKRNHTAAMRKSCLDGKHMRRLKEIESNYKIEGYTVRVYQFLDYVSPASAASPASVASSASAASPASAASSAGPSPNAHSNNSFLSSDGEPSPGPNILQQHNFATDNGQVSLAIPDSLFFQAIALENMENSTFSGNIFSTIVSTSDHFTQTDDTLVSDAEMQSVHGIQPADAEMQSVHGIQPADEEMQSVHGIQPADAEMQSVHEIQPADEEMQSINAVQQPIQAVQPINTMQLTDSTMQPKNVVQLHSTSMMGSIDEKVTTQAMDYGSGNTVSIQESATLYDASMDTCEKFIDLGPHIKKIEEALGPECISQLHIEPCTTTEDTQATQGNCARVDGIQSSTRFMNGDHNYSRNVNDVLYPEESMYALHIPYKHKEQLQKANLLEINKNTQSDGMVPTMNEAFEVPVIRGPLTPVNGVSAIVHSGMSIDMPKNQGQRDAKSSDSFNNVQCDDSCPDVIMDESQETPVTRQEASPPHLFQEDESYKNWKALGSDFYSNSDAENGNSLQGDITDFSSQLDFLDDENLMSTKPDSLNNH